MEPDTVFVSGSRLLTHTKNLISNNVALLEPLQYLSEVYSFSVRRAQLKLVLTDFKSNNNDASSGYEQNILLSLCRNNFSIENYPSYGQSMRYC